MTPEEELRSNCVHMAMAMMALILEHKEEEVRRGVSGLAILEMAAMIEEFIRDDIVKGTENG